MAPRWWVRLFGGGARAPLDPSAADLVVVAASFDDAEASSTALARATGWRSEADAVLRHHLRIPAQEREQVCAIAAQDGYLPDPRTDSSSPDGLEEVILQRVQVLDALHLSQERSRMAGLAQRHNGTADGWDALQPDPATEQR